MSDIESFHTDSNDSATASTRKRSKGKIYDYCAHFEDSTNVHDIIASKDGYLGYHWKLGRQLPSSTGSTHWYNCSAQGCNMKIQLKINTITDVSTIFMSNGEHTHDQTRPKGNIFGIDEKIKTIIRDYERINMKPSLMLRKLRDDIPANMTIPTERQLHNFLRVFRATRELGGNLGNQICLNDFTELYELHKEIPESPDQMFVSSLNM